MWDYVLFSLLLTIYFSMVFSIIWNIDKKRKK